MIESIEVFDYGWSCLTDVILLMFTCKKLTVITIIALVMSFLFSLMLTQRFLLVLRVSVFCLLWEEY